MPSYELFRSAALVAVALVAASRNVTAQTATPQRTAAQRTSVQRSVSSTLEVTEASLAQLSAAMGSGRMTSVRLVDAYLARIAAYDHSGPALNTIIRINPKARADAARLDAERKAGRVRGPLHGIPVIIKDNYDTGDMPTSAGSIALANSQPAADGFVVKRLRDAGAVILAKSNLHELAAGITSISSFGGQTRNPYDPSRCPGGSSGGTGAAIAASFAAVGWGSDTCGSIRIPSAYGSLFGLRPTQGMVSRTGIVPLSHTQDIGGPMARTATDLAIALDVSVGYDATDSATRVLQGRPLPRFAASLDANALRSARIGLLRPYFVDTEAEIADTVRAALAAMRAQGATIVDVPVAEFDTLIAGSSVLNMETKFDLAEYLRGVPNAPVHTLREIIDRGLFDRALEVRFRTVDTMTSLMTEPRLKALDRQTRLRARMERIMDSLSLDALAYPTMRQRPVLVGETQTGGTCNLSAQSGLPAISIPAGFMADGLPVGLELMGRAFTDTRLVSIAYAFEQSGVRRRAPSTTPALVNGRAPVAKPVLVQVTGTRARATARLQFDAATSALAWSVSLAGASPDDVVAVVLRRRGGPTGTVPATGETARVITRLLGPGMRSAKGTLALNAAERLALREGRMTVALFERTGAPVDVVIPR